MSEERYSPSLHRLALLTAIATFPLIFMGGLVTSHGAGMSVPDWPNSYGYNMFTFPPSKWVGGIFYEHTHRLMGTVVGFLSIVLTMKVWGFGKHRDTRRGLYLAACSIIGVASLFFAASMVMPASFGEQRVMRTILRFGAMGFGSISLLIVCATLFRQPEPRRWVRWLGTAVLGAVIFQGVLGGLRVVWVKLDLAIVHACVAQAFFCLAAFVAVVTSRWWHEAPNLSRSIDAVSGRRIATLALACAAIVYLQLIVGAIMRHDNAGLAIPDVPLSYGRVLPPISHAGLDAVNKQRAWTSGLEPVSLTQVWIHFGHRIGATIVSLMIALLCIAVIRQRHAGCERTREHPDLFARNALTTPTVLVALLTLSQATLGVLTVLLRKPADIASAHVATGALLLMTLCVIAARSLRLHGKLFRNRSQSVISEVIQTNESLASRRPVRELVPA